jgi:hypothetical protein
MQSNVNRLSVRTARAINDENVEQYVDTKGQRPLTPSGLLEPAVCLILHTTYKMYKPD